MAYEYKCVSGPTIVAVKNTKVRDQAVKAFEDIMNIEAAQGWEFVGIDEFHVSEPQGLLSRKRVYVPAKILVFRREKAGSALADAMKARLSRVETDVTSQSGASPEKDNPSAVSDLLPTKTMAEMSETAADASKNSLKSIVEKIKNKTS
jgi:flagellar hook-basal body complex protein FliE